MASWLRGRGLSIELGCDGWSAPVRLRAPSTRQQQQILFALADASHAAAVQWGAGDIAPGTNADAAAGEAGSASFAAAAAGGAGSMPSPALVLVATSAPTPGVRPLRLTTLDDLRAGVCCC